MACITRHMYSIAQMSQLWEALSRCIKGSAFDSLCDELHGQADPALTHTMLKHTNGAIYVRRGASQSWVDLGNAVYTMSYVRLGAMCASCLVSHMFLRTQNQLWYSVSCLAASTSARPAFVVVMHTW